MSNNLNDLLLHPKTKQQLESFLENPSHALLVIGVRGSGKNSVATALAANLLQVNDLASYPYFFKLERPKNKQDIPIENVREVINKLRLKSPGKNKIRKLVFIENAHNLSIPAQNALLKALEEPSADTVFILSVTSEKSVLSTIASRSQKVVVQPVGYDLAKEHWQTKHNTEDIDRAWKLSQGSAGLMFALLSDDNEHPLRLAVGQAKKFLGQKTYERLLTADSIGKNKEEFSIFLDALNRTLHVLHHNAIENDRPGQAKKLLRSRKATLQAYESLVMNANVKLVALQLVLKLKV